MADVRDVMKETEADRQQDAREREQLLAELDNVDKGEIDGIVETTEQEQDQGSDEAGVDYKALYEEMKGKYEAKNRRYIASSKENRKLLSENKQLKSERAKANQVKELSEEELKQKYSDWDDMTVAEQKAIKRAEKAEARAAAAEAATSKYDGLDEYNAELDTWLDLADAEGKFIDVREQIEEFKAFARKSENRGRDLDELAKIFTFDHPKKQAAKPSTPFGNSARQAAIADKPKLTPAQEERLRKTDFRKYTQMVMKGEI